MKNLGRIEDPKDIITKEFLEGGIGARVNTLEDNLQMADSDIETLQTDVQGLQTDNTATKAAVKTLQDTYVPNTRKVNGKALDADITLSAENVGTVPATWTNNNEVDHLVISGSFLGGDVELGYLNDKDGYYYGYYKRNAYIQTLYNGSIEVSAEPTTGMGIVNKDFLESKLDIFWAIYKVTTYQEVANALNTGKKVFLTSGDEQILNGLLSFYEGESFIFIAFQQKTMLFFFLDVNNTWTQNSIPISPVTSVNTKTGAVILTASDVGAIPNTIPIPDIKVVTNVSCPLSAWVSDTTTYTDYQFKADLTVADATADYIPLVNFAPSEQESGNYIGATSGSGIVTIWCKSKPSGTITIPNIILTKEN